MSICWRREINTFRAGTTMHRPLAVHIAKRKKPKKKKGSEKRLRKHKAYDKSLGLENK